jgi:hypothetical protein
MKQMIRCRAKVYDKELTVGKRFRTAREILLDHAGTRTCWHAAARWIGIYQHAVSAYPDILHVKLVGAST